MKKRTLFFTLIVLISVCTSCSKTDYDYFAGLYGIVTDQDTGEPIGNASIVLSPGGKTKTTGNDGLFEFNDLDPQQYTITVQKTNYRTNRKTVTAIVGEKTEASVPLTKTE